LLEVDTLSSSSLIKGSNLRSNPSQVVPKRPGASAPEYSLVAITRKVAKAVSHPLRVRILAALNEAEMGPGGFTRMNPDVDLREASRHFRRLRDLECIELIGRRPGRGREQLYRAVRRAMFDLTAWEAVPAEKRSSVTGEVLSTFMRRVGQAAEAGTLDLRDERWVTWTALEFDEQGWGEFLASVEGAFDRALKLGVDAPLRMASSAEDPMPVTVGLFYFESAPDDDHEGAQLQPSAPPGSFEDTFLGLRSPKALASELRVRILVELNRRPLSPKGFHSKFADWPLQHVAVEFRRLEELRCIEPIAGEGKKPGAGRGRPEQLYRPLRRSLFDEETWRELPSSLRSDVTGITFTTFIERVAEAARAGVLDRRADRHLTWSGLHYDQVAWREMLGCLDDLFRRSLEIHEESAARVRSEGTVIVPVTVGLTCFESPSQAEITSPEVLRKYLDRSPNAAATSRGI
jgi:DNA-binding transcriptional ArsR family regulator